MLKHPVSAPYFAASILVTESKVSVALQEFNHLRADFGWLHQKRDKKYWLVHLIKRSWTVDLIDTGDKTSGRMSIGLGVVQVCEQMEVKIPGVAQMN